MNVWDRFNGTVDTKAVEDSKAYGIKIPKGEYRVRLLEMEATETKTDAHDPMIKGKFVITDGDLVSKYLFYNQTLRNINYQGMTETLIAQSLNFIGGLLEQDISFTDYGAYADLINSVASSVSDKEFIIEVGYAKKDIEEKYPKLTFVKVCDENE